MTTTLTARRLFTDIGEIEFPVLTLENGRIADIASDPSLSNTDILTAAFLDIHTHGAVGHDVMTPDAPALARMQQFFATRGVAHYLPTTVTAPLDTILRALDFLASQIEAATPANEARPLGIHLEGPFLSHAKRGVHPAAELQPPSIQLFDRFQQAARGHIKLLTLAPETSGALALVAHATSQNVRVSLGHSNATASETIAAISAGAVSATHTFNAMRPLDHREPGILGTVLDTPALFADIIADGIHVDPAMVRLWFKAKAPAAGKPDRRILITDSMSATGCPDGAYKLGAFDVTVRNGRALLTADLAHARETLAGSLLTLDAAVANLIRFTEAALATTTACASHNPAAMLGLPALTRLAPGSPAHLNRFDAAGHLTATYLHGEKI